MTIMCYNFLSNVIAFFRLEIEHMTAKITTLRAITLSVNSLLAGINGISPESSASVRLQSGIAWSRLALEGIATQPRSSQPALANGRNHQTLPFRQIHHRTWHSLRVSRDLIRKVSHRGRRPIWGVADADPFGVLPSERLKKTGALQKGCP